MEAPNSGEEVNEGEGRSGHAHSLCRGYDSSWEILDGEGGLWDVSNWTNAQWACVVWRAPARSTRPSSMRIPRML